MYQAAVDVLGPVTDPRTIHQAKFSMGFVLALIAVRRSAGVSDFTEETLGDPRVRRIHDKVRMIVDPDIDSAYPKKWSARVLVTTTKGRRFSHKVSVPKGDPGNALTIDELKDKFHRLASMHPGLDHEQRDGLTARALALEEFDDAGEALRIARPAAAARA